MKRRKLRTRALQLCTILAAAVPLLLAPGTARAQEAPAPPPRQAPGSEPATAEVSETQAQQRSPEAEGRFASELDRAREELRKAQQTLEQAAREVARLSAQAVDPVVDEVQRQWFRVGQRAMIGLSIEDAPNGARVSAVSPGGPAAEAGIQTGDVIVAINGTSLTGNGSRSPSRTIVSHLRNIEPGTAVGLTVLRDGEERRLDIETRDRAAGLFSLEAPRLRLRQLPGMLRGVGRWRSMELVTLTPELGEYFGTSEGLLVVRPPEDDSLQLRSGDVILDIGGRKPNSPEHAMRILATFEPGETLRLTIMRRQSQETLEIRLPPQSSESRDTA